MKTETIPYAHILPGGICDFSSGGVVFLFLEYRENVIDLLNQITRHIQKMDVKILTIIEKNLNLQLRSISWDVHGNVCFADDPGLRPEYRTNYHAMDLWDYYYAVWHSQEYWNSIPGKTGNLPLPHPDLFWKIIRFGTRLRELHSLKAKPTALTITVSDSENNLILSMETRFVLQNNMDKEGRLHLNDDLYLDGISRQAWEYQLAGVKPLQRWFIHHMNQSVSSHDIEILAGIIKSVEETRSIQITLDQLFSKYIPRGLHI